MHIPIGFAPLPIVHNFEGMALPSAQQMCTCCVISPKLAGEGKSECTYSPQCMD